MYSQHDEEQFILQHCPDNGRFLDIGAYHPLKFSNVRALYERGWSGVMVEPSPLPMDALLREYGYDERVTLIQALVAPRGGELMHLDVTQDAVSTTENHWFKQWRDRGGFYGKMLVPSISVQYLKELGPFDFVSIDTEGTSAAIMREVVKTLGPACICAEVRGPFTGYHIVYENGTNTVYVKS